MVAKRVINTDRWTAVAHRTCTGCPYGNRDSARTPDKEKKKNVKKFSSEKPCSTLANSGLSLDSN
jgi:hypothetical protein